MIEKIELVKILASHNLNWIEKTIAEKIPCRLYKDNSDILIRFMQEEIDLSYISLSEIVNYIDKNSSTIVEFGVRFLRLYNPEMISIGIAITYSIYLIYLEEKGYSELLEFLKRRRIPQPENLATQITSVKNSLFSQL